MSCAFLLTEHVLVGEASERHHVNPIRARVGVLPASEHHEESRTSRGLAVNLFRQRKQMLGTFLYTPLAPQLDFHRAPAAIVKPNDCVGFQPCLVAIVENPAVKCSGINAKVSNA